MGKIFLFILFQSSVFGWAAKPCGGSPGVKHGNGGGFVAATVTIPASAYVDGKSHICGKIKILNTGNIINSRIDGDGTIQNTGGITDSTIKGYVLISGNDEKGAVTLDGAKIKGPTSLNLKDSQEEWIRITGNVTVKGHIEGSNISIHDNSIIGKKGRVSGRYIEVEEAAVNSKISDCVVLKGKIQTRHSASFCQLETSNDKAAK